MDNVARDDGGGISMVHRCGLKNLLMVKVRALRYLKAANYKKAGQGQTNSCTQGRTNMGNIIVLVSNSIKITLIIVCPHPAPPPPSNPPPRPDLTGRSNETDTHPCYPPPHARSPRTDRVRRVHRDRVPARRRRHVVVWHRHRPGPPPPVGRCLFLGGERGGVIAVVIIRVHAPHIVKETPGIVVVRTGEDNRPSPTTTRHVLPLWQRPRDAVRRG